MPKNSKSRSKSRKSAGSRLHQAFASPVGLVLLGAIAGAVLSYSIPRILEQVWPSKPFQETTATAFQNIAQETYFIERPDWVAIGKWQRKCQDGNATLEPFEDANLNSCYDLTRFGGVDKIKHASITITNPQDNSITITDIVANVVRKTTTGFQASYHPPVGAPIENVFTFNLDLDTSRARYVKNPTDYAGLTAALSAPAYFDTHQYEVEPHRSASFGIAPHTSLKGIVEWKIRVTVEEADESGSRRHRAIDVTPQGVPFRGVGFAVGVNEVLDTLP